MNSPSCCVQTSKNIITSSKWDAISLSIKIESMDGQELIVPSPGNIVMKVALMDPDRMEFLQSHREDRH